MKSQSYCFISVVLFLLSGHGMGWSQTDQAPNPTPTEPEVVSAEESKPKDYKSVWRKAVIAYEKEDFDKSIAYLNQASAIDPQKDSPITLKGAILVRQKKYQEAKAVFKEALKLNPNNAISYFNMGETLFLLKEYKESKEMFQKFLSLKGYQENALGRFKIFLCDLLSGNKQEVKKKLQSTEATISHPLYYYIHAADEFHQGNDEKARDYLKSSLNIYNGPINAAFADSFLEIGWLKKGEIQEISAVNAAALKSLSKEFQPEKGVKFDQEIKPSTLSKEEKSHLDSLLPSLDGSSKEEKEK